MTLGSVISDAAIKSSGQWVVAVGDFGSTPQTFQQIRHNNYIYVPIRIIGGSGSRKVSQIQTTPQPPWLGDD